MAHVFTLTERIRDCCQTVRARTDGEWNAFVVISGPCVELHVNVTRDGRTAPGNRLVGHAEIDKASPELLQSWFDDLVKGANAAITTAPTLQ